MYTGYGSADWYAKDPDATGSTYGSFAFPVIIVPYVRMTGKKEEIMVWVSNSLASYGKQTLVSHVKVLCLTHPSIHPDIPSLQRLCRSLYHIHCSFTTHDHILTLTEYFSCLNLTKGWPFHNLNVNISIYRQKRWTTEQTPFLTCSSVPCSWRLTHSSCMSNISHLYSTRLYLISKAL